MPITAKKFDISNYPNRKWKSEISFKRITDGLAIDMDATLLGRLAIRTGDEP